MCLASNDKARGHITEKSAPSSPLPAFLSNPFACWCQTSELLGQSAWDEAQRLSHSHISSLLGTHQFDPRYNRKGPKRCCSCGCRASSIDSSMQSGRSKTDSAVRIFCSWARPNGLSEQSPEECTFPTTSAKKHRSFRSTSGGLVPPSGTEHPAGSSSCQAAQAVQTSVRRGLAMEW